MSNKCLVNVFVFRQTENTVLPFNPRKRFFFIRFFFFTQLFFKTNFKWCPFIISQRKCYTFLSEIEISQITKKLDLNFKTNE